VPDMPFVFRSLANIKSVFICVHLCPIYFLISFALNSYLGPDKS
jgi:hypothetical protein